MTVFGRTLLYGLLLPVFFLGSVSGCEGKTVSGLFQKAGITPLESPRQAQDFILPDVDGTQVRLKDFQGKVVILNIWAMWCAPCREEMPSLEKLHQHFTGSNLAILAVSVDMADIEVLKAFTTKHKYTFTILHDPRGTIMKSLGVRLIPVTYLIDESGKIIGKAIGLRDWSTENVIRLLEKLLEAADEHS
jgi:cytochrome c biogenesis protein CcmG/thiol:disulfide interchange protein DsbE